MLGFHIINARDNSLLDWIFSDYSESDPSKFMDAMQDEAQRVRDFLSSAGLEYDDLKSALTPTLKGRQAALLFDWREFDGNYGVYFARKVLPHLRKSLRTSVLIGDLLELQRPIPISSMRETFRPAHVDQLDWRTLYAMYFTNLNDNDVETLHRALVKEPRYRGVVDASFSSDGRDYLADTLVPKWVMSDRHVVMSHGPDDLQPSDQDVVGYGLHDFGYSVVGFNDMSYTAFLSYKIEAAVAFQAEEDRALSLAAITGKLVDIASTEVVVAPDKLTGYLLKNPDKLKLMTSIGLQDVTPSLLASIIKDRLVQNYVYDLRVNEQSIPTLTVLAEFVKSDETRTRRKLALKYEREGGTINLVSMY